MRIFSRNPEPAVSTSTSSKGSAATSPASVGPVNVLVVEDSHTQTLALQQILEERGYRVESARNGKEALSYLTALRSEREKWHLFRPTLVLSDIMMPEMDGNELCRQLKLDEELKEIPVILLTSLTDAKEALRGLYSGADYLISKPYEPSFLMARIDDVLATLQIDTKDTDKLFTLNMDGQKYHVSHERLRVINSVFTVYETAVNKNLQLEEARLSLYQHEKQLQEAQQLIEDLQTQLRDRTIAPFTEMQD